ncbi:MAG TPA: mechanosensitive ion channel domain-containing protein [Verrucomicrobiae bacterium]|nr:mechanosensitive ion channel domain-containing protein [Verrucomicrobiae bacterium]
MNIILADSGWLFQDRFPLLKHNISIAGVAAFAGCVVLGLCLSSVLQSGFVKHLLVKLRIDKGLTNFITSLLSLAAFAGLVVLGVEFAGIPIPWEKAIPGVGLSPLQVASLVVWIVAVIWGASAIKKFVLKRFLSSSGMAVSLQYTLSQVIGYVALALGLIIAMQNVGINLSALAVFAGAVGVGLGLGLQTIASNFISGLQILAERPIKIGDRVTVDGMTGQVESIRVRATTVVTNDNVAMIIPNSRIVSNTITNWSYGGASVRFHFPVVVSYGSNVDQVRAAMLEAAKEHPGVLQKPEPSVVLDGFAENLINFELLVWTEELSAQPQKLRSELNFAIEKKLRERGVGKFKV